MGAVYQAAALSKGYRVKKFLVKDANQYPINVQFDGQNEKLFNQPLFNQSHLYPSRKLMTFNKHIDDFSFDIHYGNLTFLSTNDKRYNREKKECLFSINLIIFPRLNGLQQLSPIPCHRTTGGEPETAKVCARQTTIVATSNMENEMYIYFW